MKKNKLHTLVTLVLVLVLGLSSCKTKQVSTLDTVNVETYTVSQVLKEQPTFDCVNMSKVELVVTYGTQQLSFRGFIKGYSDSLLVISVQPLLGIEMLRVEFTPEKFIIVDKMNRRYTENTYDFLRYKLSVPLDFKLIQSLFYNQLFVVGNDTVAANRFIVESLPSEPTRLVRLASGIIQRFELLNKQMTIGKSEILMSDVGRITTVYTGHSNQNGIYFPSQVEWSVQAANKSLALQCSINKIEFNKPFVYQAINLERYEKVVFSKIIP